MLITNVNSIAGDLRTTPDMYRALPQWNASLSCSPMRRNIMCDLQRVFNPHALDWSQSVLSLASCLLTSITKEQEFNEIWLTEEAFTFPHVAQTIFFCLWKLYVLVLRSKAWQSYFSEMFCLKNVLSWISLFKIMLFVALFYYLKQ